MGVTIEQATELYTLSVKKIGEVLAFLVAELEKIPDPLEQMWRNFVVCTFQLEGEQMIILEIEELLRH